MTQQELADALGVSLRTIGNWEAGRTVPGSKEALLLDVLGDYMQAGDQKARRSRFENVSDAELLAEIAARFARGAAAIQTQHWQKGPEPTVEEVRALLARIAATRAAAQTSEGPFDEDLDALEDEREEPPVLGGGRRLPAAALDSTHPDVVEERRRQQDRDAEGNR